MDATGKRLREMLARAVEDTADARRRSDLAQDRLREAEIREDTLRRAIGEDDQEPAEESQQPIPRAAVAQVRSNESPTQDRVHARRAAMREMLAAGSMTPTAILNKLSSLGIETKRFNVQDTLRRFTEDFEKVGDGTWRLAKAPIEASGRG